MKSWTGMVNLTDCVLVGAGLAGIGFDLSGVERETVSRLVIGVVVSGVLVEHAAAVRVVTCAVAVTVVFLARMVLAFPEASMTSYGHGVECPIYGGR